MALIKINENPSRRELRQFAALWLPLLTVVIALIVYAATKTVNVPIGLVAGGVIVGAIGVAKPAFIHPVYLLWMYATYPIGWVISHVILAVIFFGIFTPVAFVMKLVGYDPMRRRLDAARSDWVPVGPAEEKRKYFKQF
jgi:hypothetical protein